MTSTHLSTTEYARQHKISKMQVTRLIRAGKIVAERVGRDWMIVDDADSLNQIGMEKTTSLQKWAKIIEDKFHKTLRIEQSKDREIIYSRLSGLGLPHERYLAFSIGHFPAKNELEIAIGRLGLPYWISAVPDPTQKNLNRQTKLGICDLHSGWDFISRLPQKNKYKIIVMQYPKDPGFKGTALISPKGLGVCEFITGDRHYILTRGFTMTDPMLFDQSGIRRFSQTISFAKQKHLFNLLRGIYGHLELQYGKISSHKSITFLDFNDEAAYIEIDHVWENIVDYFKKKHKSAKKYIYGLPASPGIAKGRCLVVHHENIGIVDGIQKGDILVSDTTTPEMTTLMKKASAIITDLGGITSHAAIVCRELKIPAIVGTITATEKLRTGDKIRVDANTGEVKILATKEVASYKLLKDKVSPLAEK